MGLTKCLVNFNVFGSKKSSFLNHSTTSFSYSELIISRFLLKQISLKIVIAKAKDVVWLTDTKKVKNVFKSFLLQKNWISFFFQCQDSIQNSLSMEKRDFLFLQQKNMFQHKKGSIDI